MTSAFAITLEEKSGETQRAAKVGLAGGLVRRGDQRGNGMTTAIKERAANVAPRTNVAASKRPPITNRGLAEKFAEAVQGYSAAQLAKAADRTKNAAKGWLDGSRAPDSPSLLNMARNLQCVQELMFEEGGVDRAMASGSADGVRIALARAAAGDGPEAQLAARLLGEWMQGRG